MKYSKQTFVGGSWVKGGEVVSGTKVKIVSETVPTPSKFQKNDGTVKMQDVAKVKFQGVEEVKNINLNRATLNGLVDAFGEDSKEWIGKVLTAVTEKMVVGGKRVTAVYLLADGYELKEDENGYMEIVNPESVPANGEVPKSEIPF
ncbi:MAG: hypothetical protein AAB875_06730 [Patescibacteria group bacterium]